MKLLKTNSWLDFFIHLGIIAVIGVIAVLFFFYVYLPLTTNHGETITVPDVVGVHYDDLDEFLTNRDLRFEVSEDSSYSADEPPQTVLQQFPLPGSKVKADRKVYVTLNTSSPPLIEMPNLVDASQKTALMVLKSYELKLGNREYAPDLAFNAVLAQLYEGDTIAPGTKIPKGSTIDLVLGNGLGNQSLESPNLIGQDEESARIAILGSGLVVGNIRYEKKGLAVVERMIEVDSVIYEQITVEPGAVSKQEPAPGRNVKLQQKIDLWIYKPDSVNLNPSILDQ
jgi:beta-lactam-binding protein with PASTA domain